ncbi:hypothetical protein EFY79_17300 [Hanamia caeni]|uniref:Uncharacterized protein n=1 Tax=Hanamia caeni TaxID=2294116 RepID=A0A3M9N8B3_9BACT|nr:hypothetical protein EFY79_17300 [Hanamia caeni]
MLAVGPLFGPGICAIFDIPARPELLAECRIKKLIICLPTGRLIWLLMEFARPRLMEVVAPIWMFISAASFAQNLLVQVLLCYPFA